MSPLMVRNVIVSYRQDAVLFLLILWFSYHPAKSYAKNYVILVFTELLQKYGLCSISSLNCFNFPAENIDFYTD